MRRAQCRAAGCASTTDIGDEGTPSRGRMAVTGAVTGNFYGVNAVAAGAITTTILCKRGKKTGVAYAFTGTIPRDGDRNAYLAATVPKTIQCRLSDQAITTAGAVTILRRSHPPWSNP